jgi:hypothetical protein
MGSDPRGTPATIRDVPDALARPHLRVARQFSVLHQKCREARRLAKLAHETGTTQAQSQARRYFEEFAPTPRAYAQAVAAWRLAVLSYAASVGIPPPDWSNFCIRARVMRAPALHRAPRAGRARRVREPRLLVLLVVPLRRRRPSSAVSMSWSSREVSAPFDRGAGDAAHVVAAPRGELLSDGVDVDPEAGRGVLEDAAVGAEPLPVRPVRPRGAPLSPAAVGARR